MTPGLADGERRGPLTAALLRREVASFLAVGAAGYVVDVVAFNVFRSLPVLGQLDPTVAKVLAVAAAMVVTYLGNRLVTWRGRGRRDGRVREVAVFAALNLAGLGITLVPLVVSHDLLRMTSRLADNVSANVVGLAAGTAFRYWTYRRLVFADSLDRGADQDPAEIRPRSSVPA